MAHVRRQRSDARRNHDVLVDAAREVFARCGADAPLDLIAQRAGVGRGSLYRHFPTREHMIAAVLRDSADTLDRLAAELAGAADPVEAVTTWLRRYDRFATAFLGLAAQLEHSAGDGPLAGACAPMRTGFAGLWERAQRAGRAHQDLTADQVLALVRSLPKDRDSGRTGSRYLDVVLGGLRLC